MSRYVTPGELCRAGRSRLVNHLLRAGRLPRPHVEQLADAALAAAQAQRLALPGERLAAELVRELAGEALAVRERLARLDTDLEQALERHPDTALIRSLPGMGGDAHRRVHRRGRRHRPLPDPRPTRRCSRARAPAQTVPAKSATSSARGGNKVLKRVLYQSAFCSLSHPASRAFYTRKRREGKCHHQAVIALPRRRVDVLHAILRTRQPYRYEHRAA